MDIGKTIKDVGEALKPLADKLGSGAAEVYKIYVRQQFSVGVVEFAMVVVLSVIATFTGRFAYKLYKEEKSRNNYGDYAGAVVWGIVAGMSLFVAVCLIPDAILHLLNPQYYAIHQLLCSIKNCGN